MESRSPTGRVAYLVKSALHIVRLPPWANVPAQRMWRMNAFVIMRSDKTVI